MRKPFKENKLANTLLWTVWTVLLAVLHTVVEKEGGEWGLSQRPSKNGKVEL